MAAAYRFTAPQVIRVGWHPLAGSELFEASEFYDEGSPGLGEMFLDEVEAGSSASSFILELAGKIFRRSAGT